ncbi:MAG: alpha-amylase family glycosyl hydrolase [Lachnospiraceae bacterium]|nr:alpha-amylase family glycosyl hydrolase [Lachnospiraceae bacterium]MDD7665751.1 alpha-amylase family glycosyl hydrolase [Lachnospiraceae bacterium]MDY4165756.1 alpha-amylase family glycosyl hydrolase [Lachnospiraceae bacterium]
MKRGNETRKAKNRILGLVLALAMVVTLLPGSLLTGILARGAEGTSEAKNVFVVAGTLAGDQWKASTSGNEVNTFTTTDQKTYSISYDLEANKTYEFKVLQDPDANGWNLTWNVQGGCQEPDQNAIINVKKPVKLTLTLDATDADKKVQVKLENTDGTEYTGSISKKAKNVFIAVGTLPGANWSPKTEGNEANTFSTTDQKTYSISYNLQANIEYQFKVLQDPDTKGWNLKWNVDGYSQNNDGNTIIKTDKPVILTLSLDATDTAKKVTVKTEAIRSLVFDSQPAQAVAGKDVTLDTTATYYDGTEADKGTAVTVSYSLPDTVKNASISSDGKLSVEKSYDGDSITVIAAYGDYTQKVTLPVVAKTYNVTINFYAQDFDTTKSDIYIFENGGNKNLSVPLTSTVEDSDNGITWASGTAKVPFNKLGIIARKTAGTWDGGQDGNKYFTIPEDSTDITLWYVFGETPVTEKPTVEYQTPRYLDLTYTNDSAEKPFFYSWTINDTTHYYFEKQEDGTWHAKIKIPSGVADVKFVLGLDDSANDWVKDGGDHDISFTADQNLILVSMDKGEEPKLAAPLNKGYEIDVANGVVNYYYRDDEALQAGTLSSKKVSVEIKGSDSVELKYNEANKRFEGTAPLEVGRTEYRYNVDGNTVLDTFNANQTTDSYSYFDYYKPDVTITAKADKGSLNYNTNDVIRLTVNQKDISDTNPKAEIASATVDASALGAGVRSIDADNLAVTIACTEDTKTGNYELPVSVKDQYGNVYTTSVTEKVTARTKSGAADDFDWDEASIYFMVTDRFFDGDSSNDTANDQFLTDEQKASGLSTYGKNAGLYHGGDFKGIEDKLDYLKNLGINTIWITPIVQNIAGVTVGADNHGADVPYNAAYHGYWASDFTKLNPALGTEADFQSMIDAAHAKGIKIMVDVVLNHAGYGTEDTFGSMLRSGDDVVSGDDQKDSLSNLPDFKTEDKTVRDQLVAWQTAWVKKFGIDYFRVDTVKHVDVATWQALKNSLTDVAPSFKMIGEYSGGGAASNGGTLGTGAMDSDLDFDFNDWATQFVKGSISTTENNLTGRNDKLNNTYMTGQFLGSHDEDGFVYKLTQDGMSASDAEAAGLVAASLQITAKGQPVIYYGEETGQSGANNYPYQDNRYDMDWSKANDSNPVFAHYKKMLAIRNKYVDVYARGDRKTIDANDEKGYDVFTRTYDGTTLYNVLNTKNKAQTVTISGLTANGVYTDFYSGKTFTADASGSLTVTVPASSEGGTVIFNKVATRAASGSSSGNSGSTSGNTGSTSGNTGSTDTISNGSDNAGSNDTGKTDDSSKTEDKTYTLDGDASDGTLVIKDENGKAVSNKVVEINDKKYATLDDGTVAVSQSVKIDGKKYVATSDGSLATKGLVKVGKKTFVVKTDQTVASAETVKIGKKTYVAQANGLIAKKQIVKTSDGRKVYADKNGCIVKKKVVSVKGSKYYTNSKGQIVTGKWVTVGKKKYYCSKSGKITKTKKVSKKK